MAETQIEWLTGVAPTTDVPKAQKAPPKRADGRCPTCAQPVLHMRTRDGTAQVLDHLAVPLYVLTGTHSDGVPMGAQSSGYAVHRCGGDRAPAPPLTGRLREATQSDW